MDDPRCGRRERSEACQVERSEQFEPAGESENTWRWHAFRSACEHGCDWALAYDLVLHPDTRVATDEVPQEWARDAGDLVTDDAQEPCALGRRTA